jgi:cytochrome b subunit of formate dehydrogenase
VHGQAAARGETDTPVCTDCHGDHSILPVSDPRSPVSPTAVSLTVCAPCHESRQLNVKYGLPTNILQSWRHSYHGLKSTDGDPRVANCSSCHRAHLILPESDPASSIAPAQVQATCARCHPSISPQLARIEIHRETGIFLNRAGHAARAIYLVAILVIIGAMVIHWLIDLRKRIRVLNQGEQVVRMSRDELGQHTLLMVSFTLLAITGFAFHYSGSWWTKLLFGWPGGFLARRWIHLVSAGLFFASAAWHVRYLFTTEGRRFLRDVWPRGQDFAQFFHTMAYDLDLRSERPRFGRFSYIEKAEYWALVWGAVVMTVTGLALWFGTVTEHLLKVGALGVMLVVHFYEAILAGLAILIWHLYSTIFNPPVYPNNPSWYTGKMPRSMFREEHPDDPSLAGEDAGALPAEAAAEGEAEAPGAEAGAEDDAEAPGEDPADGDDAERRPMEGPDRTDGAPD